MKKVFVSLSLVLAAFLFAIGTLYSAPPKQIKIAHKEIFKKLRKSPTPFNHEAHVKYVGEKNCVKCHHTYKGEGEPKPCAACHEKRKKGKKLSLKNAFHKQCKGCHRKSGKKTAPTRCKGCHP